MAAGRTFDVTHQFRGNGKVNEAEDWIRSNVKGLWALEFLGMQEEFDETTGNVAHIFHIRFKFGRSEDSNRFQNEYILGKKPAATVKKAPPPKKKKGFWARLLSG